jgi:hypothetical protein
VLHNNLAFRAQLVIPEQREVYDYWLQCCEENKLPSRRNIEPKGMRAHLSHVTLFDVDRVRTSFKVRLAGTGLRDVYGQDITGSYISDIPFLTDKSLKRIVSKARPAQGVSAVNIENKDHLVQFWLKLPLSEDGVLVNMVLGFDVFLPMEKAVALTQQYAIAQAS